MVECWWKTKNKGIVLKTTAASSSNCIFIIGFNYFDHTALNNSLFSQLAPSSGFSIYTWGYFSTDSGTVMFIFSFNINNQERVVQGRDSVSECLIA